MPQFQAEIPDPLRDHLPALLSPGRMRAPTIGIDLLILICQLRLKGAAMQVEFENIGGGKPLLRHVGEKEFVDDARPRDANGALLCVGWMGGDDHTAQHAFGSHRHLWAVVETTHRLALQSAAGTDLGADVDAPAPADDQERCTLYRASQTRSQPGQRAPPQCRIGQRYGAGCVPAGTGAP
jgi:hypothetical protein